LPERIKENPLVASLAVLASAVIAVSAFSDSAKNLFGLVHEATVPRVAGTWITPVLTNPYEQDIHYHLVFNLRDDQKEVSGSLTYFDERQKDAINRKQIGKVADGVVSFRTEWFNRIDEKTYSDFYEGRIAANEIKFETWDNVGGGGDVQKFEATRQDAAPRAP
jgi:hypothetical protein